MQKQTIHYDTKVMFVAAVARPRFDVNGNEEFSGKIGIFPFTIKEPTNELVKIAWLVHWRQR